MYYLCVIVRFRPLFLQFSHKMGVTVYLPDNNIYFPSSSPTVRENNTRSKISGLHSSNGDSVLSEVKGVVLSRLVSKESQILFDPTSRKEVKVTLIVVTGWHVSKSTFGPSLFSLWKIVFYPSHFLYRM